MFHVPGRTDGGIETEQITSTVDIFPTVVDLVFGRTLPTCGKTASGSSHETQLCTEGTSLVPLIRNPHRAVKLAAYSVFSRDVMALLEDAEEARTELVSSAAWPILKSSIPEDLTGGALMEDLEVAAVVERAVRPALGRVGLAQVADADARARAGRLV